MSVRVAVLPGDGIGPEVVAQGVEVLRRAAAMAEVFATGVTPPPTLLRQRCRACSLREQCRPEVVARPARAWRARMVQRIAARKNAASSAGQS